MLGVTGFAASMCYQGGGIEPPAAEGTLHSEAFHRTTQEPEKKGKKKVHLLPGQIRAKASMQSILQDGSPDMLTQESPTPWTSQVYIYIYIHYVYIYIYTYIHTYIYIYAYT